MATEKGWAALIGLENAQGVEHLAKKHGSGMGLVVRAAVEAALADPHFVPPAKPDRATVKELAAEVARLRALLAKAEGKA